MSKRALTIFSLTFAAVLVAGAAFAQVGVWAPAGDEPVVEAASDLDGHEEPAEEPAEEPEPEPEPKLEEEPVTDGKGHEEEPAGENPKGEDYPEPKDEEVVEEEEPAVEEEPEHELFIEVLYPGPESETDDEIQVFEGIATPGTDVFRGKFEAETNEEGGWRIALVLSPGKNKVAFEAHDAEGNVATDYVVVFLVGHEEEPKEEEGEHAFSANQKYGSCEENPPYDIFYGTGVPGATVWVESKHGGGTTTIGPEGNWDLKVTFYETTYGKEFDVVVESEGGRAVFAFTSYAGGEGQEK